MPIGKRTPWHDGLTAYPGFLNFYGFKMHGIFRERASVKVDGPFGSATKTGVNIDIDHFHFYDMSR